MLFKTLLRRCQAWLNGLRGKPPSTDQEPAQALVEALRQLAREANRLEAQLHQLSEKRQAQARPSGRPALRLVHRGEPPLPPDSEKQL
ncbi:hypothetical protein [Pseudomonas sp. zfem002]|uniref:hypothetical protein n=1 Tax=Pseudomonas sp. zfem002 TaxID=3078197 RepID=UPI00292873BC|nr:hypothetical protein [Pseudomonas sp. zfem002]MDU9393772.1 hypothetical protein [Pseudomonas sp. zfem002]